MFITVQQTSYNMHQELYFKKFYNRKTIIPEGGNQLDSVGEVQGGSGHAHRQGDQTY